MLTNAEIEKKLEQAIKYGQKRNYSKAIQILEPLALKYVGKVPKIMLYLARSYHAIGNLNLAISAFHTYVAIESTDAAGWFFLGRTYLTMNLFSKACSALSQSIELNPHSAEALGFLGIALLKMKDSKNALKAFEASLNINPDDIRINNGYKNALLVEAIRTYNSGNIQLAVRMFEFLLENGMESVLIFLYYGHCLRDLKKLDEALLSYKNAIKLSPDDPSLKWYELQIMLAKGNAEELYKNKKYATPKEYETDMLNNAVLTGNWQVVIKLGREYIKKYGSDVIVHNSMGEASRNLKRYRAALNHFQKAQNLNPNIIASRYGLLLTYLDLEDWNALFVELHKTAEGLAEFDDDTIMYYNAICSAHLDGKPEFVLQQLQEVFLKHPEDKTIMLLLANQYVEHSMYDLAQRWYERLIKLDKKNNESYEKLIYCYEIQEKWTEAENLYKKYLERWPKNHKVHLNFIRMLKALKKWAKAADETEKLLPFVRNPLAVVRDVATYRRNAKQWRQAAINYRTLIENDPVNAGLIYNFVFCLVKDGNIEHALLVIQRFHKIIKPTAEGYLIEASLLLQLMRVEQALDLLRQALQIFPNEKTIKEKIAQIYDKSGSSNMAAIFRQ
ncbi:MAG: tetratricopeptide repeat protein [Treponema sp.]|nr:tetratricopeptide repeat protein [Treponema sp.]